jgi:hypothetical protein
MIGMDIPMPSVKHEVIEIQHSIHQLRAGGTTQILVSLKEYEHDVCPTEKDMNKSDYKQSSTPFKK